MTIDVYAAAVVALFGALTGLTGTIWHALLTGKLVFGRELERVASAAEKATRDLEAAQTKERASLQDSLQRTQDRLDVAITELRRDRPGPRDGSERTT